MDDWRELDRRSLMGIAAWGLGALVLPGVARAAQFARGFTHGVASGEPGPDRVLVWTRYVADGATDLRVEVSRNLDFSAPIAGTTATADPMRDFTARAVVRGLPPGQWYYYRFIAPDGTASATGRTRTLPVGAVDSFALALFSCANLPFGWFNAYAHAAERTDLDLAVHVGDYLYEYPRGSYPSERQTVPGRLLEPAGELLSLADYRLRYAAYRADPDLQRLHQSLPMVAMWDDHEFANDTWSGGAQNHQAEEGDWAARRAAAERAYRDWMPVSDAPWRSYDVGDLATIFLPETRVSGRSQPADLGAIAARGPDPVAALRAFRDGAYHDPARRMIGADQETWLAQGMRASTRRGARWQVLAQQVLMGRNFTPPEVANWVGATAPDFVRNRARQALVAAEAGLPWNLDAWDGYPAARARLLNAAQAADANLIVLTGDTHNAWAFDLGEGGAPAGVEFATPGVTSPGLESSFRDSTNADRVAALLRRNPDLVWADTERRGYATVRLSRDRADATWHLLDGVRTRSTAMASERRLTVRRGRRRIARG